MVVDFVKFRHIVIIYNCIFLYFSFIESYLRGNNQYYEIGLCDIEFFIYNMKPRFSSDSAVAKV